MTIVDQFNALGTTGKALAAFGVTVVVGGAALLGFASRRAVPTYEPAAVAAEPAPARSVPAAPPVASPSAMPVKEIQMADSLAAAVAVAKPWMTDPFMAMSPGAHLLAAWGADRMAWADVAVQKNETSFALVRKDPDEARGRRMCVAGQIVQISVLRSEAGKMYDGVIVMPGDDLYRFIAVRSTGELLADHRARFCGVVIGAYDYRNSVGGTDHAVQLVGMFDLPENRAAK